MVPVSEFDGGYGDETLNCAALLPGDQTKLKAIDCDAETVHKGVICQTPGHAHVRSGQWLMSVSVSVSVVHVAAHPTLDAGISTA